MYKNFFGFKERPFQLVPNPAYLFLSRSHEEAMAHLTYAISQGDGFVEITGEVGTGKTTLCRAFLENLDDDTEVAYIFNPKLDSIQLLQSINSEFGINSDTDNTKDLIDTLNTFLIKKKAEGKKVILLVDEAQNLSKEVLEQLRLLSNLETTTSKLLQIILVGQPELGEMLDSHELRQLGQRITLSCYLIPLTRKETREYIRHRIQTAAQRPGIKFTRIAFRLIHNYSGGVPRLINIACDRALLTAFGLNRHKISGSIARASIKELAGRGDVRRYSFREGKKSIISLAVLCLALFIMLFYNPGSINISSVFKKGESKSINKMQPKKNQVKPAAMPATEKRPIRNKRQKAIKPASVNQPSQDRKSEVVKHDTEVKEVGNLGNFLERMTTRASRHYAVKNVMDLWGAGCTVNHYLDNMEDDRAFFQLASKQNGFLIHPIEKDLDLIKRLNLPAILEFYLPGGLSPKYLGINKINTGEIVFHGEDGLIGVNPVEMESYWSGTAYVPWKNFLNYSGIIPLNSPRDSIITLKMLMQDIGFDEIEISPFYDEPVRKAVKKMQEKHGIRVDGIVGPLTKIVLYNEKESLKIPHIMNQRTINPSEGDLEN